MIAGRPSGPAGSYMAFQFVTACTLPGAFTAAFAGAHAVRMRRTETAPLGEFHQLGKIQLNITPGDDRLRRGRLVGVVASRGSRAAS
jgi:hypothetical protein